MKKYLYCKYFLNLRKMYIFKKYEKIFKCKFKKNVHLRLSTSHYLFLQKVQRDL